MKRIFSILLAMTMLMSVMTFPATVNAENTNLNYIPFTTSNTKSIGRKEANKPFTLHLHNTGVEFKFKGSTIGFTIEGARQAIGYIYDSVYPGINQRGCYTINQEKPHLSTEIMVRPFIRYTDASGNVNYIYGEQYETASIFRIAKAAYDGGEETTEVNNYLYQNIISKCLGDNDTDIEF